MSFEERAEFEKRQKETDRKEEYQNWKSAMPEEELKRYNDAFGE